MPRDFELIPWCLKHVCSDMLSWTSRSMRDRYDYRPHSHFFCLQKTDGVGDVLDTTGSKESLATPDLAVAYLLR